MLPVIREVYDQDHDLRAGDGGQRAVDPEVGEVLVVQAGFFAEAAGDPEPNEEGERDQRAVRVGERDVEDFRIHVPPAASFGGTDRTAISRSRSRWPYPRR